MPAPSKIDNEILDESSDLTVEDQPIAAIFNQLAFSQAKCSYWEGVAEERNRIILMMTSHIETLNNRIATLEERDV